MTAVIKPNVINILSNYHIPVQRSTDVQPQQVQPEPKSRWDSFWSKARGVLKKVAAVAVVVVPLLPPLINAVSRFIESRKQTAISDAKKQPGKSKIPAWLLNYKGAK